MFGEKIYIRMAIFDEIRLYGLLQVFWQKIGIFTKNLSIFLPPPWALYGLSTTWLKVLIPELKHKNFGAIFLNGLEASGHQTHKTLNFGHFLGIFLQFEPIFFVGPLFRGRQKPLCRWSDDWRSHSWQWFQNSTRGFKISWKYPSRGHFSKIWNLRSAITPEPLGQISPTCACILLWSTCLCPEKSKNFCSMSLEIFDLKRKNDVFQNFEIFERLYLGFYWADFDEIWTGAPFWAKLISTRIWWRCRKNFWRFCGFSENFAKILSK